MHTLSPHSEPANGTRTAPAALLQALAERFGAQCSTALAVRQQHGRDEGTMDAPPPAAVVFAESTRDVQDAVRLAAQYRTPLIPFGAGSSLEGPLLAVHGGISLGSGAVMSWVATQASRAASPVTGTSKGGSKRTVVVPSGLQLSMRMVSPTSMFTLRSARADGSPGRFLRTR